MQIGPLPLWAAEEQAPEDHGVSAAKRRPAARSGNRIGRSRHAAVMAVVAATCSPADASYHLSTVPAMGRSAVTISRPDGEQCWDVSGRVFWLRTSRTGVSRHAGLMSPGIPD